MTRTRLSLAPVPNKKSDIPEQKKKKKEVETLGGSLGKMPLLEQSDLNQKNITKINPKKTITTNQGPGTKKTAKATKEALSPEIEENIDSLHQKNADSKKERIRDLKKELAETKGKLQNQEKLEKENVAKLKNEHGNAVKKHENAIGNRAAIIGLLTGFLVTALVAAAIAIPLISFVVVTGPTFAAGLLGLVIIAPIFGIGTGCCAGAVAS